MYAISLRQPWATLIALGIKTVDTKAWSPPDSEVGRRIGIHASRLMVNNRNQIDPETWDTMVKIYGIEWNRELPRGAMVATALLSGAHQVREIEDGRAVLARTNRTVPTDPHGDYSPGRWLWMLSDVMSINPPVEASGRGPIWIWKRNGMPVEQDWGLRPIQLSMMDPNNI